MIRPVEIAIAELTSEIELLKNPDGGTPLWFRLRALVAGRSMLKGMLQKEADKTTAAADAYYKGCRKEHAQYDLPTA